MYGSTVIDVEATIHQSDSVHLNWWTNIIDLLHESQLIIMQIIENNRLKRLICCILGLVMNCPVNSQHLPRDTTQERSVQLICQTGIIGTGIKNDSVNLPGSVYNAVDFRFGWKSRRKGLYPTLYRNPTFGFGFYAATFDKPEIGSPYALYGFVDFPFWNKNHKWHWLYSMAIGLSYNFNPYDKENNPLNTLIGSDKMHTFISIVV